MDASGWTRWDFWQYSDGSAGGALPNGTRKVNGIAGSVDLNEFNGTIDELKVRYVGKKSEPIKETEPVPDKTRDIEEVSKWAEKDWTEAKANGYFDGTRPGAPVTREETAIVVNRLRTNFLKLIAGNGADIKGLDARLKDIEKES